MPSRLRMKDCMSCRTERKLNTTFKRATPEVANAMVREQISISMADEISKMHPIYQDIVVKRAVGC